MPDAHHFDWLLLGLQGPRSVAFVSAAVAQDKGEVANIFDNCLLLLPVLLQPPGRIIRFLFLDASQKSVVLRLNTLDLFLTEALMQTSIHALSGGWGGGPLADGMGDAFEKVAVFSLDLGVFVFEKHMLFAGVDRWDFFVPSRADGPHVSDSVQ